ncbi:Alpha-taxilin [Schistosoma japonicum]|uniref:Alpha-taxilin n=2 Tax=Schistosoma japonicum TaxID=6182 RepID=A0A4Z2D528_SCHJA|nr:Alpha-taxilin [Schistosoma japonicum]
MVDTTEALTLQDTEAQHNNKQKKKRTKFIDLTLKELPQNASSDDKFEYICQKYYELHQDLKENSLKNKQFEQNVQQIRIERDQLQNERNRLILQKDKLETLCRELQKQNKIIQEESLSRARIEDEKRREVSDHFQTSITSIQNQLCEYQSKNVELRKENQELAEKLGEFIKQHEKREEHVDKLMETRSLELKLSEAKLNKAHCLLDQEKAKGQQKILQLEEEVKYLKNRLEIQKTIEDKLREQIVFYKEKYQSFNKTMSESRRMFDTAKEEMEKLGKRIQLSESDAVAWQGKWEVSQRSLLELAEQHKKEVLESVNAKKQVEKLSGLCRALKAEVNELRQQQAQQQQLQQKKEPEDKSEKQHEQNSFTAPPCCNEPPETDTKKNIDDPVKDSTINKQKQEFIDTINTDSKGNEVVNESDFNIHKTDGNIESSTVTSIITVNNAVHDKSDCLSNSLTQCTKDMNELKLDSNTNKVNSSSEHPISE